MSSSSSLNLVPSPTASSEHLPLRQAFFSEYLTTLDADWQVLSDSNGIKLSMWKKSGDRCPYFLGETIIKSDSLEKVWSRINTPVYEARKQWDLATESVRQVAEIDENIKVLYSVSFPAAGGLISPRDFVQVIMKEKCDDGTEVELSRSLDYCKQYLHHDVPAPKGMVRGDIKFSGISLKMTDKGVEVKYIINTDPRGFIMASVIQQAMKSVVTQHMTYWIRLCEAN